MAFLKTMQKTVESHLSPSRLLQLLSFLPGLDSSNLDATTTSPSLCWPAVSCSLRNVPNLDPCCINDPGGHFLQTQFWDPHPARGGPETWTIHGLWPDYCDSGFDQYCNDTRHRSAEDITRIISNASTPAITSSDGVTHPGLMKFISTHWLSLDSRNSNLWAHEWNKHGTCISTLEPTCYAKDALKPDPPVQLTDGDVLDYFTHAALLYNSLPTFSFLAVHGIVPSYDRTYELEHLQRAIWDSSHGADVTFRCRNHDELSEIWYGFHVRGSMRNAMDLWWEGNTQWNTWVPANPTDQRSNCPPTGIKYLPKDDGKGKPRPTSTSYTHTAPAPTHTSKPSAPPFIGKGRLMVKVVADETSDAGSNRLQRPLTVVVDDEHLSLDRDTTLMNPIPARYTGCLIRKGTWYLSHSLTSCAIFTADDDVKSADDDNDAYHLFTLASRFAPCSFVEQALLTSTTNSSPPPLHINDSETLSRQVGSTTRGSMFFSCSQNLPFQSILSNVASRGQSGREVSRRLTLGAQHRSTFFAEKVPAKGGQVQLWTDDGWGERKVRVEIYWEGLEG